MSGDKLFYSFVLLACLHVVWGQFAVDHAGNIEDTVDGYRIQYHEATSLLLILRDLNCFVGDVVRGTPLSDKLEDEETRIATQRAIIRLIEENHITPTSADELWTEYGDMLVRALCHVTENYIIDLSSLKGPATA
ncbi:uncharacterized protein LOC112558366 [Pomacea canaliculata]|uniref:uncharacterized protein LOC112558366 n=1 Tax=Pomacea canaliculata TaxID=400727 RepID=UPI000D73DDE9|nr:uncharacterized protein LOC112558366 [Pomacea canaliculata]